MIDYKLVASRTMDLQCNALREILKVVNKPNMISLAGGIPAPESFPLAIIAEITRTVLEKYRSSALQYDTTEGFGPLREALVDYLAQKKIKATAEDILITSGSQGALDSLAKVLIEPRDLVAVEAPTYLGALQAFNPYGPRFVCIDADELGIIPDALEELVSENIIKFVYLVPTFQNPTGRTLPIERRKKIAHILERYDTLLIEDDPYSSLRYWGREIDPIKTMAPDHVVYISTFSKILAPGLRVGFCVAPELIRKWLIIVKQGVDLHTSTFSQALATEYLNGGFLNFHLPKICDLYSPKLKAMLAALPRYLPTEFRWSKPEGGMFVWVEGNNGLDMEAVYQSAVDRNTAFVPGKYFFPKPKQGLGTMRLNFTMADEARIEKAIQTLSEVIMEFS